MKKLLLDIFFPISCLGCKTDETWLCEKCFSEIKILASQVCPLCENVLTRQGKLCPSCKRQRKSHFDCLVVATSYENPFVKQMIHALKYRFVEDLAEPLARLLTKSLLQNEIPLPDCLVPVPLHPRRLRWRGFNQSLLIAQKVSEGLAPLLKIEILQILERRRHNRPQMEIKKYQDRLDNVKGIFHPQNKALNLKNKTVLLLDDIATTGATLEECARVLKEKGAKKVYAAVIARQTIKT
jgi:ComF family protein